jgi:Kdo2-lipid IVA lauroyltransferase/acyltransferase
MSKFSDKIKYSPFFLLSLLPLHILYLFSSFAFLIIFYVVKLRRDVTLENLKRSFLDKEIQEIRGIEKDFYKHFCDLFTETLKLLSIRRSNIKKRFKIKNPEILDQFYSRKKSVILYTAHLENWEWFACFPCI